MFLTLTLIILIVFLLFMFFKSLALRKKYEGALLSEKRNLLTEFIDEEVFWELIEKSYSKNYAQQIENLRQILEKKSIQDIEKFQNTFQFLMKESYDAKWWEKAYAINIGCSDDAFEHFRSWVIAQGKNKFYLTLKNPTYLRYFARKKLIQNYEGVFSIADEVAQKKGDSLNIHQQFSKYELKGDLSAIENSVFKNLDLVIFTWLN